MESIMFRIMNLKGLHQLENEIEQMSDAEEAYRVRNAYLLTAGDVEALRENSSLNRSDMYFFDPLNHWTYIKPHEDYCGPYFFKVD